MVFLVRIQDIKKHFLVNFYIPKNNLNQTKPMHYQIEIEIDLAREAVIQKFNNADNLKHWQKGLLSIEHLSGEPGKQGAKSRLKYNMGKGTVEMIETITKNDLPNSFHGTYEAKGVVNIQENYFTSLATGKTRWTSKNEFRFTNLMMKILGFLMPSVFKKQSLVYMKAFKNFAENGFSVAND